MHLELPDMMSRKVPEANVQQAFVYETVLDLEVVGSRILSVGCYEDTAFELLKLLEFNIAGIDPVINYDLHTYKEKTHYKFGVIFATSVIEHVKDDEQFIQDICDLLEVGGRAILTCDFNNNYKPGDPLPYSNYRIYTEHDLNSRLRKIIENNYCILMGKPNWKGEPDFWYQGHNYSFATLTFWKVR
jgi:SAM-dependent methyltransferase